MMSEILDLPIDVALQVFAKYMFKARVIVFNFSQKDCITGIDLSQNRKNGVWLRLFVEGVLFFWVTSRKFFESLFIANLQTFLVEDGRSISRNVA